MECENAKKVINVGGDGEQPQVRFSTEDIARLKMNLEAETERGRRLMKRNEELEETNRLYMSLVATTNAERDTIKRRMMKAEKDQDRLMEAVCALSYSLDNITSGEMGG